MDEGTKLGAFTQQHAEEGQSTVKHRQFMITTENDVAPATQSSRRTERQQIKYVKPIENCVNHIVRIKTRSNHLIQATETSILLNKTKSCITLYIYNRLSC